MGEPSVNGVEARSVVAKSAPQDDNVKAKNKDIAERDSAWGAGDPRIAPTKNPGAASSRVEKGQAGGHAA